MRTQKKFWISAMLCLMMVLGACGQAGQGGNSGNGGSAAEPAPEPQDQGQEEIYKLMDRGEIISKDGDRWLVTAYQETGNEPFIDAYVLAVNDQTELQTSDGQTLTPDEVPVGAQVEVWHSGAIAESYPAQTTAAKMILSPDHSADRAKAVELALQAQEGETMARAVKQAEAEDGGMWLVEIVSYEAMEQPVKVRVNPETGEVVRSAVAENEAFRVYAPAPNTEMGTSFTVEGEARVFEGSFSWVLEDGHVILAEGHETADAGAPEWGKFQFEVSFEKATQSNIMLILYENSAEDNSMQNELIIPLTVAEEHVEPIGG